MTEDEVASGADDVGLGSHTDLQCFTLLWQDYVGGLQVLTKDGEWVKAPPIPGTLVVNIGDFLMRLTNDRFKSTVHRVYNRTTADRYSMPFFFGFNYNETCSVLPQCIGLDNPAKYEPISCGEVSAFPGTYRASSVDDSLQDTDCLGSGSDYGFNRSKILKIHDIVRVIFRSEESISD